MSLKFKILKESGSLSLSFKDIKSTFIAELDKLAKNYDRIALDTDGDIGRWYKTKSVGTYVYNHLIDNFQTLEDWLDETNGSHWSGKKINVEKFTLKDVKGLVKEMYYGSQDYQCVGIDDLHVFVLS